MPINYYTLLKRYREQHWFRAALLVSVTEALFMVFTGALPVSMNAGFPFYTSSRFNPLS
jgi:hypothetical protein